MAFLKKNFLARNFCQLKKKAMNPNGTVMATMTSAYALDDVANMLNFTKPSVSVAMKHFREEGYIVMNSDGEITLTGKGLKIAEGVYERHQVIAKALIALGVDENVAYEDSCRIEHDISDMTFEKIKEHLMKYFPMILIEREISNG